MKQTSHSTNNTASLPDSSSTAVRTSNMAKSLTSTGRGTTLSPLLHA